MGRRQHRRLLRLRTRRPGAHLPGQRHAGRQRLLLADRLQRARARPVVGPGRRHRQRHRPRRSAPTARSRSCSGPTRPAGYDGRSSSSTPTPRSRVTRDYQLDPRTGRRVDWSIEALDPPDPLRHTDESTAERSGRRCLGAGACSPSSRSVGRASPRSRPTTLPGTTPRACANEFAEPYQVPRCRTTAGRPRDACYSFGSFALEPDEALVDHPPPAGVPVLEPEGVEPVHGRLQRRRRPDVGERRHGRPERRRHRHGRHRPRAARPPQRHHHRRPSPRACSPSAGSSPTRCPRCRPSSSSPPATRRRR